MSDLSDLYDTDYGEWARRNARLLSAGDFGGLDVAHLLEELDDRAKSERRELENRLTILLAHLLKRQSQLPQLSERRREFDGRSWPSTIIEQRDRLAKRLRETPSLKPVLSQMLPKAYADAVAAKERGLPAATFPPSCPYGEAELLDESFYPRATSAAVHERA
ncbi:DUF29 domain-containing protein [Thiohalocapsa sp. ML1]|uniref:DUF29 domain-containing protein n=1 Tax=Thiohalocapsa sp. ML1 TaxID=1431688 RepID=UPI0007323AFE|nr:DUF29 domain-containing protein [Thiohalocapsa sp. ML1]